MTLHMRMAEPSDMPSFGLVKKAILGPMEESPPTGMGQAVGAFGGKMGEGLRTRECP